MPENFYQRLQTGLLGEPNNYGGLLSESDVSGARRQAMLALGAQLMAAGGPSAQPVSLGQALGGAIMGGQQSQQQAISDRLNAALLKSQITRNEREQAGPQGVQSTVIGEDGFYYTVDRLTGEMTNTGVKAAPSMRIVEQEGNTPFGVVTGRGPAGHIVPLKQSGDTGPVRTPTAGERERDIAQNRADVELATQPTIAKLTTEATETSKHDVQRRFDRPAAQARLDSAFQKIDLFTRKAGDIANNPDLSRATGLMAYIPSIFGGGAKDVENAIDALKAQIGFQELQDMRANSPTGGALGSVTERELNFLQNSLLSLERSQSPEQYRSNLLDIIEYAQGMRARLQRAFDQTYPGQEQPNRSREEILKQYGL